MFLLQKGRNMSHELYESWLLSEQSLTAGQKDELKAHLQTCPQCRKIASGWQATRQAILSSGSVAPQPGFSTRWQATLAERRQHKQKLTIRWLLLGLVVSALVSFSTLFVFLTNTTALLDWWLKTSVSLERTAGWLSQIGKLLGSWLGNVPGFLPPLFILLVISSAFIILILLWVSVAKQFSFQGAIQS